MEHNFVSRYILDQIDEQNIVRATFSTGYVVGWLDGDKLEVVESDDSRLVAVGSGIWLTVENFPGRNRGWRGYFHTYLPFSLVPDALDELWGMGYHEARLRDSNLALDVPSRSEIEDPDRYAYLLNRMIKVVRVCIVLLQTQDEGGEP